MYITNINYINHVVHHIPSTYLSYNWKFVPFDLLILNFILNLNGESQKNFNGDMR